MRLSLNGNWRVTHFPYAAELTQPLEESFVPEGWLNAEVPEEIHATLRRAGVLRGNTYGKTKDEERWVEEKDWVYHKEFFVPEELRARRVVLDFQGLDTFCELYLNGEKLGFSQNMHLPFCAEVGERLRYGDRNVLLLRFYSPVKFVEDKDDSSIFSITKSDRIFARKAQMNYGWDFCGRCVTTGIWKEVSLRGQEEGEISSYYLRTKKLEDEEALLALNVETVLPEEGVGYTLRACLEDEGEQVLFWEGLPEQAACLASAELRLSRPRLWWPAPYGEPHLYDFTLSLYRDGDCVQTVTQKFGVRTVEVLQEEQADGKSFQFAVNGKKLFLRGANWVPVNTVTTDIRDSDYEELLDYAAEGNLSMLRIWGGGIYESPRFFELCDEKGILVWSDFMLACGIYPQDEDFLFNVRAEGEHVVRTYRNYTCLAIWAGDNENGQAYGWAGRPYEFQEDKIANVVLREVCEALDPDRFYLATSPCSPFVDCKGGDNPNSPYQGDSHIYIMSADPGIRADRDYGKNHYKRILGFHPRFVSEFGFISFPEKDSFYRFNVLREQNRHPEELREFFPAAADCLERGETDRAVYLSQVFQSMALKYWIEYFRTLKGTCAGTLYWKFNDPLADCPEGIFPSHMCMVDMYGQTKMAYYYTRRAYDNILLCFVETAQGWEVTACSEEEEAFSGRLLLTHRSFSGEILGKKETECTVRGDSATVLCRIAKEEFPVGNLYREYVKAELVSEEGSWENRFFFAPLHECHWLCLEEAGVTVTQTRREGEAFTVRLRAERFARNVRLHILDCRARYSDNYFDLDAGQERELIVTVRPGQDWRSAALYVEGENVKRQVLPLARILQ